ncbi:hypothetical protein HPC49_51045, partial [Pyxidicoccus fallax]|nr:hypothetical protein [Pyxidicoccus fallax]NPC86512.1 hypothetical protein [Pyxidicoccus fallax]
MRARALGLLGALLLATSGCARVKLAPGALPAPRVLHQRADAPEPDASLP